ncbi:MULTISPECIES: head decoration protein [unclassified Pseudomonas]|uniref:head decoration protein n=1 Tax=unclassified Pseudomonas TaxID=196821 RepID=UPI0015A1EFC3|nr:MULTISPECIES: head decoration protein [unclassified Pseudomonas]NWC92627.1 head decoration protein [Pseudomonas sp. IPO3779]NWD15624.1 head decoration protein [Pseudomonas sp. IPO3778]
MSYVPQTPLVEQRHAGGFIVSLANGHQSIDQVLINQGFGRVEAGTVLADVASAYTATGTATAGNTGNGTMSGVVAQAPALTGTYIVTLTSETEFLVVNPNGEPVPAQGGTIDLSAEGVADSPGAVGAVFNSQGIGFLVAAGSAAFVSGDSFNIVVAETGGGWTPLNSASADVAAYGLLYRVTDTTNGPATAAAVVRNAEVNGSELVWDPSLTAAQQDAAIVALKSQGVVQR